MSGMALKMRILINVSLSQELNGTIIVYNKFKPFGFGNQLAPGIGVR